MRDPSIPRGEYTKESTPERGAAKPVGGHSAGDVLLTARPHGCWRIPRGS